jgi:hypothetical protein
MPSCPSSPEPLHKMRTRKSNQPAAASAGVARNGVPLAAAGRARERRQKRTRESDERTTRGPRWRGAGPPWRRWECRRRARRERGGRQQAADARGGGGFPCAAQDKRPPCRVRGFCGRDLGSCATCVICAGKGWLWRQWAGLSFWVGVRSGPVRRDLWSWVLVLGAIGFFFLIFFFVAS